MTVISRLKSNSVSILAVLGLLYFGLIAYLTVAFVGMGLKGHLTVYLLACILLCIYSARLAWSWAGLLTTGFALNFRGLYAQDDRIAYIAPWVRSFAVTELSDVREVQLWAGWRKQAFIEFDVSGGGKWRLPGFMLSEPVGTAVARAKAILAKAPVKARLAKPTAPSNPKARR